MVTISKATEFNKIVSSIPNRFSNHSNRYQGFQQGSFNKPVKKNFSYWCKICNCSNCKRNREVYYAKKKTATNSRKFNNAKFNAILVEHDDEDSGEFIFNDYCPYTDKTANFPDLQDEDLISDAATDALDDYVIIDQINSLRLDDNDLARHTI